MSGARGAQRPTAASLKPVATEYFSYHVGRDSKAHRDQLQVWNAEGISLILQGTFKTAAGRWYTTYFAKKHMLTLAADKFVYDQTKKYNKQGTKYFAAAEKVRKKGGKIKDKRLAIGQGNRDAKYGFAMRGKEESVANTFIVCNAYSSAADLRDAICGAVADEAAQTDADEFDVDIYLAEGSVLQVTSGGNRFMDGVMVRACATSVPGQYAITHLFYGFTVG